MSQKGYRKLLDELAPDHESGKQWLLDMLDAGYTLMEGGEFLAHAAGPDGGARLVIKHHVCSGRVMWRSEFRSTVSAGFPTPVTAHAAAVMTGLKVIDRPQEQTTSRPQEQTTSRVNLNRIQRAYSNAAAQLAEQLNRGVVTGTMPKDSVFSVDEDTLRSELEALLKGSTS